MVQEECNREVLKKEYSVTRAHVGKFLGYFIFTGQKTRAFLKVEEGCHHAQDHDIFISLTGALYVVVNSEKDKGKALKKHILKDIVPRGFDVKIEEIQEIYRQAFEEEDVTIALLNGDPKNRESAK